MTLHLEKVFTVRAVAQPTVPAKYFLVETEAVAYTNTLDYQTYIVTEWLVGDDTDATLPLFRLHEQVEL